ncbi:MAG: hypothetical protein LBD64_01445 [Odoribacteraceae bacterium]|jgi:hypothetical protein|nr:hypothetical protein [Odoribacteraceae bacterium]
MEFGFLFWVLICILVARLGIRRKIGFGWALFFCLLFSPIIGLVIILCSRKIKRKPEFISGDEENGSLPVETYTEEKQGKGGCMNVFGWFSVVLGTIGVITCIILAPLTDTNDAGQLITKLFGGIGVAGLGIYLILRAKEKKEEAGKREQEREKWIRNQSLVEDKGSSDDK